MFNPFIPRHQLSESRHLEKRGNDFKNLNDFFLCTKSSLKRNLAMI